MGSRKRKVGRRKFPTRREIAFSGEGKYFDLETLFQRVNREHFGNALPEYRVLWGRKRKHPPLNHFVFATIQEEERVIRVHPLLDAPFVPLWFMEFVLYHEMLHAVVADDPLPSGRRRIHTEEFRRREREFPFYQRAVQWERENLERFFR